MYVDTSKEDPSMTHAADLKPLSRRKIWKMRHRKILKKKSNSRLERKGIYMY